MEFTREARMESEREAEQRNDWAFEEPDAIEIPQRVKDRFADEGMTLRWIRVSLGGKDDLKNVSKRRQDGWDFVEPNEVPELIHDSFVREDGRYAGTVSRGDLALAKAPIARMQARQEYFENKSREMMQAVDAQLGNVNSRANSPQERIQNNSRSQVAVGRSKFQD